MSKSRKGKKTIYNLTIKQCEKIINDKFNNCPFNLREELFINLEKWANDELGEIQQEIFLKALYNAESTQKTQMVIGVKKALEKINK